MRVIPYFLGLSLASVALGCSSSSTDTTTIARPELVAVSPDDFLGSYTCGRGQVQSYVATLFDISTADGGVTSPGFQLPSSPPTSCLFQVTFSDVITGERYLAQVDLYRAPVGLTPLTAGSRVLVDASGVPIAPYLQTECGDYPPTLNEGAYGGSTGATVVSPAGNGGGGASGEAGAQQTDDTGKDRRGLLSYDGETRTAHDCTTPHAPMTN